LELVAGLGRGSRSISIVSQCFLCINSVRVCILSLEELIRSTTSEYGIEIKGGLGKPRIRKVGIRLINLAISENSSNLDYITLLEKTKAYFSLSKPTDAGGNRNNVVHGYMHPRYWNKESFEQLLHVIATLSKYAKF
jgi:hypothetical protein